ncbi:hypothetical protein BC629DRAFT_817521 [Irpex lacteus]|nr:hypothetical protein BC629DRAFT_817521 [Irpex lacteus]
MLEHGKHPTKYHYDALIESYSRAGDMAGAKMTLVSARKAGYARLGQSAYAEWIFRAMVFRRVRPDVAAVDARTHTYLVAGHVKKAWSQLLWFLPFYGRFSPELHDASTRVLAKEFRELGTPRSNPFTDKPDVRKKITRVRLGRWWKACKTEKLSMDDMV